MIIGNGMGYAGPTLGGLRVVVNQHITPVPVLKIPADFIYCSPEFRARHDAWLLKLFGAKEMAYQTNDTIFMSPAAFAALEIAACHVAPHYVSSAMSGQIWPGCGILGDCNS